ncbi:hypothetical protein [uncultured Pontibacter sp.]|uniref:hypothetical protein n=1 Tax=uncultured Pontibacter sp. TaxID=453356 RepID=UPI00261208FE|nr:hypothetical protein [uncultured Pontibacter sp.]
MTEIRIEKKKKPVWPWILLVVILLLLGWAIYELVVENEMAHVPLAPPALVHTPSPELTLEQART